MSFVLRRNKALFVRVNFQGESLKIHNINFLGPPTLYFRVLSECYCASRLSHVSLTIRLKVTYLRRHIYGELKPGERNNARAVKW